MSEKVTKQDNSYLDAAKWCVVGVLLMAAIAANHYFSDQALLYRVIAGALVLMVATVIAVRTERGAAVWDLLNESIHELRRIVWPTGQETVQTTAMVMVVVFIMGVILWLLDFTMGSLASYLLG